MTLTTDELLSINILDLARGGLVEGSSYPFMTQGRRQDIGLAWTPCTYGGERPWFVCPACGRRVAILYLGERLACRRCLGLYYESQRTRGRRSALLKLQRLRERLGGSANLMKPFPARPKGMRHQIYERLRRQADELEAAYVAVMVGELRSFRQRRSTAETVGTGQVGDRL